MRACVCAGRQAGRRQQSLGGGCLLCMRQKCWGGKRMEPKGTRGDRDGRAVGCSFYHHSRAPPAHACYLPRPLPSPSQLEVTFTAEGTDSHPNPLSLRGLDYGSYYRSNGVSPWQERAGGLTSQLLCLTVPASPRPLACQPALKLPMLRPAAPPRRARRCSTAATRRRATTCCACCATGQGCAGLGSKERALARRPSAGGAGGALRAATLLDGAHATHPHHGPSCLPCVSPCAGGCGRLLLHECREPGPG